MRLRLNCSNDDDFESAVELYSKSLAISGYNYQTARSELLKCKDIDRVQYLKGEQERKKKAKNKNNKKVFWISTFDPRVPHPRQVLTKNYQLIEGDPIAREVFERKNLVAGSRRGKNLQELISSATISREEKKCELCNHMGDGVNFVDSKHFRTKLCSDLRRSNKPKICQKFVPVGWKT